MANCIKVQSKKSKSINPFGRLVSLNAVQLKKDIALFLDNWLSNIINYQQLLQMELYGTINSLRFRYYKVVRNHHNNIDLVDLTSFE